MPLSIPALARFSLGQKPVAAHPTPKTLRFAGNEHPLQQDTFQPQAPLQEDDLVGQVTTMALMKDEAAQLAKATRLASIQSLRVTANLITHLQHISSPATQNVIVDGALAQAEQQAIRLLLAQALPAMADPEKKLQAAWRLIQVGGSANREVLKLIEKAFPEQANPSTEQAASALFDEEPETLELPASPDLEKLYAFQSTHDEAVKIEILKGLQEVEANDAQNALIRLALNQGTAQSSLRLTAISMLESLRDKGAMGRILLGELSPNDPVGLWVQEKAAANVADIPDEITQLSVLNAINVRQIDVSGRRSLAFAIPQIINPLGREGLITLLEKDPDDLVQIRLLDAKRALKKA